ncbi:MAG: patatin-like phospholipase family protein [Pseudolabrys sp.]
MGRVFVVVMTAVMLGVAACASVHNLPLNKPSERPFVQPPGAAVAAASERLASKGVSDGAVIGLAFSGGGTRAAAFAHGVLQQLSKTPTRGERSGTNLLDHVGLVSGVSGGSVAAAYFGLRGQDAVGDFREKFLVKDVMGSIETGVTLGTLSRALGGGVNTDNKLRDWFNANLFDNATFLDFAKRRQPVVLINATNIYSRSPFPFAPISFAAACSDITQYPVAGAVAASAAVPAAFAPVVIESFPNECTTPLPEWVTRAAADPTVSPLLHAYAKGLVDIRSGKVKYVKLFDGGLIDNYGLSAMTIMRAGAGTPYGPLRPEDAVRLRRFLFLVVDAGRGPEGDWASTLEGPAGKELVGAVVDVLVDANAHSSYAAFEATLRNWRDAMVRWRCGLKPDEVERLRGRSGPWNCRDLKIDIAQVNFAQLDPERAKTLNAVPTSFTLPADSVDDVIRAGGDALASNPTFKRFLKEM